MFVVLAHPFYDGKGELPVSGLVGMYPRIVLEEPRIGTPSLMIAEEHLIGQHKMDIRAQVLARKPFLIGLLL
ncbi:unannotated protein [freshwater metagenome]|uniref:Unannotated protein n=1 Tax=freshwater metagenome TaxID=449393 RepID=A0A6J6AQ90_9ZZZZ